MRAISFALLPIKSGAWVQLTEAHPCDDLTHGAIQVLQHAEIVCLALGLLKQLLMHAWQLGVCDVRTERLRMRQNNRVGTDHEIRAIFWVCTLRSGHQPMGELRRGAPVRERDGTHNELLVHVDGFVRRCRDGVFVDVLKR